MPRIVMWAQRHDRGHVHAWNGSKNMVGGLRRRLIACGSGGAMICRGRGEHLGARGARDTRRVRARLDDKRESNYGGDVPAALKPQ